MEVNPIEDKRALFIQLMWFSAILASIASLVTAGIGLQNYLNTTGVPDFAAFLNSESGLDNVNVDLSLFATLILAILLNLAALMAECGFMFVVRSLTILGTLRGRGIFYIFMAPIVGGFAGTLGVIMLFFNLSVGLIHFSAGCCCIRATKNRKSIYDTHTVNPGFTHGTVNLENRISQAFGGGEYDYGEDPYGQDYYE